MSGSLIGHDPILSELPIIASSDLSEAYRIANSDASGMSIGAKIREARKERGLTQQELAKKLEIAQSTLADLEAGKLKSWSKHSVAVSRALAKPVSYFEGNAPEPDQPPVIDAFADLPAIVNIPEYDVRLSAGAGFYVDQETTRRQWPLPRFLVVDNLRMNPAGATIQEVIGDSMEPTLSSGDYVLIDLNDQRIGLPGIFAVWDGDALVCKRVERVPGTEPSEVRLKSDNPLHGEYRVQEEMVKVIGRVRWVTRRM